MYFQSLRHGRLKSVEEKQAWNITRPIISETVCSKSNIDFFQFFVRMKLLIKNTKGEKEHICPYEIRETLNVEAV